MNANQIDLLSRAMDHVGALTAFFFQIAPKKRYYYRYRFTLHCADIHKHLVGALQCLNMLMESAKSQGGEK